MKQMNNNNIRSREKKSQKKKVFCFFLLMKLCDVKNINTEINFSLGSHWRFKLLIDNLM